MARACTTCAKAKARCIPGPSGALRCERCHRLDKDCSSRPPAPPRAKKRVKRSRVAELEMRLDELSSQFDQPPAVEGGTVSATSPPAPLPPAKTRASPFDSRPTTLGIPLTHLFPTQPAASKSSEGGEWDSVARRPWQSLWPLPGEAEKLIEYFHSIMAPLFPFIVVRRAVPEIDLRTRRPYLWKSIMVASTLCDGPRQVELGHKLLSDISNAALIEGRESLDLLQSLMLLIAWFHYALKSTQLTNLLFLARSMCAGLATKQGNPSSCDSKATKQNLDHLRAFAGTYYLNTLVFATNKRTDVFMDTSNLDNCCSALEAAKQYPSDEFLVKLVKIQQIAQSISSTMTLDSSQLPTRLPLLMVVESFQARLDAFRASIPVHLSGNKPLSSHISIAEVLLFDFAISDQHCNSSIMPLTDRLRLLWSCVSSLRSFLTVRFAVHNTEGPRFLCLSSSDLAYVIITGMKLLTLRLPGWNLEHIAKELRLGQLVQHQIEELEEDIRLRNSLDSTKLPSAMGINDPWERTLRLLMNVRDLLHNELEKANPAAEDYGDMTQGLLTEVSEAFWQDVIDESMWNMDGDATQFDMG